jgi:excisionase family DNA binding protein
MIEPLALSIPGAEKASGVGRSTLYKEIARGNLKVHKVGRRTLITMENLRAWLASKAIVAGREAVTVDDRD